MYDVHHNIVSLLATYTFVDGVEMSYCFPWPAHSPWKSISPVRAIVSLLPLHVHT